MDKIQKALRIKSPMPGNLVVERLNESDMTDSGRLYIPQTANRQESACIVRVVKVSPPFRSAASGEFPDYFTPGDLLIIGKWQGTEVTIGRRHPAKTYLIINESSVLAILEEDDGNEVDASATEFSPNAAGIA